ncbi:unnamed protein product [Scytosiphon promiscuus]
MGRVRKYKKVKAVDPFAKGGGGRMGMGRKGGSSDMDRNLPPDVKNHEAQRLNNLEGEGKGKKGKNKRRLPQWAHDELKETAKRVREEHADPEGRRRQPEPKRAPLEGKRDDESMRQFNKRVREGTAQLLKDEFKEHSSTNKRRKKYLDDKKRKNKLKKQGLWEEVQRRERLDEEQAAAGFDDGETARGGAAATSGGRGGRGRHGGGSAVGGGKGGDGNNWGVLGRADDEEDAQYPQKERIRFGDVAHAPPDLAKIPKPRGFKHQGQAKPWARQAAAAAGGGGGGGASAGGTSSADNGSSHGQRGQTQSQREKKRGKTGKNGKSAIGEGGGEEAGEGGEEAEEQRQEQRQMEADAKKAQKRQMEEMRLRVQEAYSGLKKKRRAGQTQFVGSDL